MVSRQVFSRGPSLFPPSQPLCVALLRDMWRQSLGCWQQLLFHVAHSQGREQWRDEDAGSCLCYCDLLQDRPRAHTPAPLEYCSQVCHGDQSLGEPEKSDLPSPHTHSPLFPVILDSLVFPVSTMFLRPWVPTETCWMSGKKHFSHCIKRKVGTSEYFHK